MQPDTIVYVIDDDEAVRQSVEFLLKTVGMRVHGFESAKAFLELLPQIGTSCVVTDVRMPEMTGIELLRRVREVRPDLPVIVITGHGDVPLAVEAMKLGAADFIEKPFDDEVLLTAIKSALGRWQKDARQEAERTTFSGKLATLSNRERDVLNGLVAGKPNKVIAFDLGISPRTVEIYRANVMTKMSAGSLSELVRIALLTGLIGPDSGKAL